MHKIRTLTRIPHRLRSPHHPRRSPNHTHQPIPTPIHQIRALPYVDPSTSLRHRRSPVVADRDDVEVGGDDEVFGVVGGGDEVGVSGGFGAGGGFEDGFVAVEGGPGERVVAVGDVGKDGGLTVVEVNLSGCEWDKW